MRNKASKNYDIEFKQSSAKLAMESDKAVAETARDLGINANTLFGWIKKYGKHYQVKARSAGTELEQLAYENAQLRKENIRLKQERDILKKATAYFASEMP